MTVSAFFKAGLYSRDITARIARAFAVFCVNAYPRPVIMAVTFGTPARFAAKEP